MKCEPSNFRVASCDSGNLRVVSYNSISMWVVSCEFIIRLCVRSSISLHYITPTLSVYIISSLHVKQSKSNKILWYTVFQLWYTPVSNRKIYQIYHKALHLGCCSSPRSASDLPWFKWKWIGKICKYLCKYKRNDCSAGFGKFPESKHGGVLF